MRLYRAKFKLNEKQKKLPTGLLGEKIFAYWFKINFQGEVLHKQKKDRDFAGIDFADEKGITYQVKATKHKSYTFNCSKQRALKDIRKTFICDFYVFIKIEGDNAYIEGLYDRKNISERLQQSFSNANQSFIYAKNLLQENSDLVNLK